MLERPVVRLAGPFAVVVVWVREDPSGAGRLGPLDAGVLEGLSLLGFWFERVLVLTNLDGREAGCALAQRFPQLEQVVVLGASELGHSIDRHAELRAAMPSVLGVRDLSPLISPDARRRSSFDLAAAQELARVFWPTHAYERARATLAEHRFVVLTGPPEMGKTAIARMLGARAAHRRLGGTRMHHPGSGLATRSTAIAAAIHGRRCIRVDRIPPGCCGAVGSRRLIGYCGRSMTGIG